MLLKFIGKKLLLDFAIRDNLIIGPGSRVHLRLLRALGYPSDVSSPVLLATTESGRCSRSLSERSLSGRRCEAGGPATLSRPAARQEGMDARRACVAIKAHVSRWR